METNLTELPCMEGLPRGAVQRRRVKLAESVRRLSAPVRFTAVASVLAVVCGTFASLVGPAVADAAAQQYAATGPVVMPAVTRVATPERALCGWNSAILTQTDKIYMVDLATGESVHTGTLPFKINGIGYNELDGWFYGANLTDGHLVRFKPDGTYESLGSVVGVAPSGDWNVGEIDHDGFMWLASSSGTIPWRTIDLRPGSETYAQVVASGTTAVPAAVEQQWGDWVAVPGHEDVLYAMFHGKNAPKAAYLVSFNKTTGKMAVVKNFGGIGLSATFGALYADANGYIFASDNTTGGIYRITPDGDASTLEFFAQGPPSTVNDGAMCTSVQVSDPDNTTGDVTIEVLFNPSRNSAAEQIGSTCTPNPGNWTPITGLATQFGEDEGTLPEDGLWRSEGHLDGTNGVAWAEVPDWAVIEMVCVDGVIHALDDLGLEIISNQTRLVTYVISVVPTPPPAAKPGTPVFESGI